MPPVSYGQSNGLSVVLNERTVDTKGEVKKVRVRTLKFKVLNLNSARVIDVDLVGTVSTIEQLK